MKKVYYFDYKKYSDILDETYPMTGLNDYLDYNTLTYDNFEKIKKVLEEVINNPKLKDYKVDEYRKYEELTCLSENAKQAFDQLFSNPDIYLYGHGGNAKEIIESEGFRCRYANLESHFIPLEHTNESLSKLDNWPHRGYNEIAILALNNTEYNPIYKERERKNTYDTDIYTIPNEYFAGYYDSETKTFTPNPNFKLTHEYNPEITRYEDEDRYSYRLHTQDQLINDYFRNLDKIRNILFFSKGRNLSKKGYIDVKSQAMNLLNKANEIQNKLSTEYIENLTKSENKINDLNDSFDSEKWGSFDWDIDDWDLKEEEETKKTR